MGLTASLRIAALTICLVMPPSAFAQFEEGDLPGGALRVRNLSPVVQLYGMPRMSGARIVYDYTEATFNFEAANNFQSELRGGTFAFFDGETYVGSYRLRGGFNERFEWGAEVPYVAHSGGSLDGVVDEFHELFGLPDGERSLASRGRLDYFLRSGPEVYADFSNSRHEIGDVRGFLGYQVFAEEMQALALRTQIKVPTGNVADLSGSEGWDFSVWGEYERGFVFSQRTIRLTLGGGVSYLGEGELIPDAQEDWLWVGHLGVQIPLHPRVEFHAQIDAHTDVLDTGNPLVAEGGLLGTLGGRIGLTKRLWMDVGLIEDLENESASDVVFQVLFGAKF